MIVRNEHIEPCPFGCDPAFLDIGRQSSNTFGISCRDCRCTMERQLPSQFPIGVPELQDISDVRTWTLNQVIDRWNRRGKAVQDDR